MPERERPPTTGDGPADDGAGRATGYTRRAALSTLGAGALGALAGCSAVADLTEARPRWRTSIAQGLNAGPPVATAGRVALGTQDKRVYAFDAESGDREFAYETGGPVETAPAVASADDLVHAHSTDGDLYAIDGTGSVAWHEEGVDSRGFVRRAGSLLVDFDPHSDTVSGYDARDGTRRFTREVAAYRFPGLTSDVFVVPVPDGPDERRLVALSPADGSVRWESDPALYRDLAVEGDRVVDATTETVTMRALADGTVQWQTGLDAEIDTVYGSGVQFDGDVYVSLRRRDEPGVVVALDGASGDVRWRREVGYEAERVVPADDGVYVASSVDDPDGGIVIRIDGYDRDGTRRWQRTTDVAIGGVVETCTLVDGLFVVGSDRHIRAYATADGSPQWHYEPDRSRLHVQAADEALYLTYRDDAGVARLPTS
jgi:outer membrane protein assembly factor BamB